MKKIFGVLICLLISTATQAESPKLAGSWKITFHSEPPRAPGAVQCVEFTLVPGTVGGVATSGTWTSPTFPNWHGQWIQLGDHVRWFGISTAAATTESGNLISRNLFAGVAFNHFATGNGTTFSAGSWTGTRVASCAGIEGSKNNIDPAQKST